MVAPATEPIAMALREGENGLLFSPGGWDELRRQLQRAVDDENLRRRLGAQARRDSLAEHTWRRNAEKTLGALCEDSAGAEVD